MACADVGEASLALQWDLDYNHRTKRVACPMVQERPGRVERRLSAILAADVAGYSRRMGLDEVLPARSANTARSPMPSWRNTGAS